MTHVEYGGVFVKESKAPDSFLLDENAYYVEITEQDKTYEVENEAGIGFVNMAQTGALRIEKTSSDGKLEGFAFRITGANGYDETFVTDENGEIHVELRVGSDDGGTECVFKVVTGKDGGEVNISYEITQGETHI